MKTSELIKLLKKYDVKFIEYRGRHDWYYSSITKKSFPIWRHAKEIPKVTLKLILKQAGIK
ncbi:type II toxin-antitoxin system HicA family toxin [Megamonas hypermegale]|uniref:type II toxin-antitoxin system HicA family toxin n=1 Tax=Megamonas hypermegale TaxID=158847 RepID=UPI00195D875B|nr:type II toxin-antitoxin system HicA family toxin [Megamonas hypermegale]MBM6834103.1 type II toxin-antitoxin system HicA family toxin [Megamonas hypermegale]